MSHCYGDAGPYHAVNRSDGSDRFDYDANGNMTVRNKGVVGSEQTLVWDAENRLAEVQDANGTTQERYGYDAGGARVRKTSGTTTTYTFFAHYEEEVTNGVTTAISHYTFGGLRIAVKRGSALYHVHGDHLGSTSVTTAGSVVEGSRAYYPYGAQRSAAGTLRTDRTFTGQKEDGTGLLYYNARYYDPALGTFISPDSMVPDAGMVVDYNRFLYARGNPLKYSDPTGNDPLDENWEREFYDVHNREPTDKDRYDRLFSLLFLGSGPNVSWTYSDWKRYHDHSDPKDYWNEVREWPGARHPGLERFAVHVERLASYYTSDEALEFTKAFGFIFGGIPLRDNPFDALIAMEINPRAAWAEFPALYEGYAGWDLQYVDLHENDFNPSHHYAGLFSAGFLLGFRAGYWINYARDGHLSSYNAEDIRLGHYAALHGSSVSRHWLTNGRYGLAFISLAM